MTLTTDCKWPRVFTAVLAATALLIPGSYGYADSCVDCHSDENLLVKNKKLHEYYEAWQSSTHGQEDVSCTDCHGGNNKATTIKGAHGNEIQHGKNGATNYANVPNTCGTCHSEIEDAYKKSNHYKHLKKKTDKNQQGPNCVTCHGSMLAETISAANVAETCVKCHDAKHDNHPDVPEKAERLLFKLGTARGFTKYIRRRADDEMGKEILKTLDPQLDSVIESWHTFDLDKMSSSIETVLEYARTKKDEVRKAKKKK